LALNLLNAEDKAGEGFVLWQSERTLANKIKTKNSLGGCFIYRTSGRTPGNGQDNNRTVRLKVRRITTLLTWPEL
jgi:hypothetical protein